MLYRMLYIIFSKSQRCREFVALVIKDVESDIDAEKKRIEADVRATKILRRMLYDIYNDEGNPMDYGDK